jgi:antitoxin HicB
MLQVAKSVGPSILDLEPDAPGEGAVAEYEYTVLFEPAEEGGYVATCPALPGLVTEGETLEEARAMAEDAIRGYIESLQKDGLPIPPDKKLALDPVKEEIRVAIPELA